MQRTITALQRTRDLRRPSLQRVPSRPVDVSTCSHAPFLTSPRRLAPTLPQSTLAALTASVNSMDLASIEDEAIVQLRADVTSNANPAKEIKAYTSDVAIDIVQIMPSHLREWLTRNNRANMAMIAVIPMPKSNCFAISAPNTIAKLLFANATTAISCDDDNTIALKFVTTDAAASANRGAFLWCHAIIGPFDNTTMAALETNSATRLLDLGLKAVRCKPMVDKIAGTWLKKMHIDLETLPSFDRSFLCNTEFDLPDKMHAKFSWGSSMKNHFGLCPGDCARIITSTIYTDHGTSYLETNKGACRCKSTDDGGGSRADTKRKADAIWARRLAKKKRQSAGAGSSSDVPPPPEEGAL